MKKYNGYDQAPVYTGDFETLEPGGYICKILQVKAEDKDYGTLLRIDFDIVEGEHKDFYKRKFEQAKLTNSEAKWAGMYYQTVKQDDLKYFKGFISAIEKSNNGYKWDWDEAKLKGKLFGGIFGQEEFLANDGTVKLATKCRWVKSVEQVREGVEAPEIKKLNSLTQSNSSGYTPIEDDSESDLPF